MKPKVSCIIPAYNEAPRIGKVLSVVANFQGFDEVIIVDDGSSDGTSDVVKQFPVKLITLSQNQGKSGAIWEGLQASKGELIVMIDSDLVGLTHQNLQDLLEPALDKRTMSLSLRGNTWSIFKWEGVDMLSGERVVPRYIMETVFEQPDLKDKHYLIECYINEEVLRENLNIIVVPWSNVTIIPKVNKEYGYWKGLRKGIKMVFDIYKDYGVLATLSLHVRVPRRVYQSKRIQDLATS